MLRFRPQEIVQAEADYKTFFIFTYCLRFFNPSPRYAGIIFFPKDRSRLNMSVIASGIIFSLPIKVLAN